MSTLDGSLEKAKVESKAITGRLRDEDLLSEELSKKQANMEVEV